MATAIAMMVGGAVLNSTTFVGGTYLAKYLSSGSVVVIKFSYIGY